MIYISALDALGHGTGKTRCPGFTSASLGSGHVGKTNGDFFVSGVGECSISIYFRPRFEYVVLSALRRRRNSFCGRSTRYNLSRLGNV